MEKRQQREYPIVGNLIGDMLDDLGVYKMVDGVKAAYQTLKEDLTIPEKPIYHEIMGDRIRLSAVPINTRKSDERRSN